MSDAASTLSPVSPAAPSKPRAILTPTLDLLVVGGLWILIGLPLIFLRLPPALEEWIGEHAFVLITLINVPHFMASYWLLYSSREQALRYPWASFVVPALLLVWAVAGVLVHADVPIVLGLLLVVAGGYLAWHYTGQTWGMMAVFAHVDGFMWTSRERLLVRTGLRFLLVWHVVWFLRLSPWTPPYMRELLNHDASRALVNGLALLSIPLGGAAFWQVRARSGRLPSARAITPWIAVHLWYVALWWTPAAILWVQLGHALQYLAFPARVELNRQVGLSRGRLFTHLAIYGVLLIAVGITVFDLVPLLFAGPWRARGGDVAVLSIAVSAIVNVHHYFTDGCVWKISNPDVRKDLLSHLAKG